MSQITELQFLRHAGAIALSRKCVTEALHIAQTRIQSIAFAECYDDKKLVLMDHHKWDETGQAVSMRKKPLATCFSCPSQYVFIVTVLCMLDQVANLVSGAINC